jgi:hypothetical protein
MASPRAPGRGGELRKLVGLVAVLALMLVLAAPAFAFEDLSVLTFGDNCVVNDFVEICSVPLGGS